MTKLNSLVTAWTLVATRGEVREVRLLLVARACANLISENRHSQLQFEIFFLNYTPIIYFCKE